MINTVVLCYAKIPARGPVQSFMGPGGSDYKHGSFSVWQKGKNQDQYYVFEPDRPKAAQGRFVLFIHDRMATEPGHYMGQIEHMCKNGWVVVFPKYQGTNQKEKHYMFNVIRSVKDFLLENFARQEIEVNRESFAIVGIGSGAVLGVNVAATADYFGLPKPLLIMPIMPEQGFLKPLNLGGISKKARLVIITGDRVEPLDAELAHNMFYTANRVNIKNKALVYVVSDFYGQPPLIADKLSAFSPRDKEYEKITVDKRNDFLNIFKDKRLAKYTRSFGIDCFDWYVTYRLFDLASHLVFEQNSDLKFLKKSPDVNDMGYWSDGRKVKGFKITDRP